MRGFPLGVMQAVSSGKVVNPYDRDQEQGWDHVDFVVDALLSEGNSGSPVMAASCRSRELELVGVYHAGYKGHSALNVVVGIDQLTEFMRKKRRIPRALTSEGSPGAPGAAERTRIKDTLAAGTLPLFDFGGLVVRAEPTDGALLYHLYGRQFPLDDRRIVVIEDLAKPAAFGEMGRLWVLGPTGWREWPPGALGTDERELLGRVVDSIRLQIVHTLDYRRALANPGSPEDAGAAARCRARSRATCRWRATWPPTCSRPPIACRPAATRPRRRAPLPQRHRPPPVAPHPFATPPARRPACTLTCRARARRRARVSCSACG